MSSDLKHARVITKIPRPNEPGTLDITTESYHEELNGIEQQIQKSIKTSKATLPADIMACLREITAGETIELNLQIITHKITKEPTRIVKTWTVNKEYYGR